MPQIESQTIFVILFFIALPVIMLLWKREQKKKILSLEWPKKSSHSGFRRRLQFYLRFHGIALREYSTSISNFIISRNAGEFNVEICASTIIPSHLHLAAADIISKTDRKANDHTILICADAPCPQLMKDALVHRVFVLHYMQLNQLVKFEPLSSTAMRFLIKDLIADAVDERLNITQL